MNTLNYYVHKTAIVDQGASIGENSKIWHWSHVCSKAKIGKNVNIGQNVFISNKAIIGDNCKIQNNVSIYDNVILEDYVFCGPSVVFTNVYNPRSMINRKHEYKSTIVKKGVTLGANSTIVCGIKLGKFSFIAAGSVVKNDIKSYALVAGNPSVQKGWITEYGIKIPHLLNENDTYFCEYEKKTYMLKDKLLIKI